MGNEEIKIAAALNVSEAIWANASELSEPFWVAAAITFCKNKGKTKTFFLVRYKSGSI